MAINSLLWTELLLQCQIDFGTCFPFSIFSKYFSIWASLVAQTVKNLPAMWETQVWSLGQKDSLEEDMTTHYSILAWRIPWTEEPGGLQSMGSQRVGHDWATNTHTHFSISSLISPWNVLAHLTWDSLCFLDLGVCFPHQVREVFNQYFLK